MRLNGQLDEMTDPLYQTLAWVRQNHSDFLYLLNEIKFLTQDASALMVKWKSVDSRRNYCDVSNKILNKIHHINSSWNFLNYLLIAYWRLETPSEWIFIISYISRALFSFPQNSFKSVSRYQLNKKPGEVARMHLLKVETETREL